MGVMQPQSSTFKFSRTCLKLLESQRVVLFGANGTSEMATITLRDSARQLISEGLLFTKHT